jgi:glucosamine--fructose-6-phosphate aminotransferase (isomerizing)
MEYRGYDSAGIVTLDNHKLTLVKAKGKISALKQKINGSVTDDKMGIGHTRWATHGEPNELNAHPHVAGNIAVVHNGIVENYRELREELAKAGVKWHTETDSEVIACLINKIYQETHDFVESVQKTLLQIEGTFGLAVLNDEVPGTIIVAKRGSPLQIGVTDTATFIASDASALVGNAKQVIYIEDDQLAICKADDVQVLTLKRLEKLNPKPEELTMELKTIQKQGYDHFLLKEIMEQPSSVEAVLRGRLLPEEGGAHLGGLNLTDAQIRKIERIVIIGCGTAYYAGTLGKYYIEKITGIPVDVEIASEFRYRDPVLSKNSVALVISQSGETADTLACVEELKRRGVHTLGLINVVGSSIARAVDGGIYLHAGPEISVASTKAFTNQVVAQLLFAVYVGRRRELSFEEGQEIVSALERLPKDVQAALKVNDQVKEIAGKIAHFKNAFYLGRNTLFPIALEGAIKLKEISYIHAEAYPAGEAKHGPIALVDPEMLVVFLLAKGPFADKSRNNLQEMKARGGTVLAISDLEVSEGNYAVHISTHSTWTAPLLLNIPQQLLAYHAAVSLGADVDQPRNLAKSVTVE